MTSFQSARRRPLLSVSVVLPAYNAEKTIERAVDSVLSQKVMGLELILIDDGSTDGTARRAKKYGKRIRYIRVKNGGPGAARNLGIRLAKNPLIAFIDADDQWLAGKLEHQIGLLGEKPEAALIATGVNDVRESGEIIRVHSRERAGNFWRALVDGGNCITLSSVLLRKDALKGWREPFTSVSWYAEDLFLWIRLSARHDFYVTPRVCVNYFVADNAGALGKYDESAIRKVFRDISLVAAREGGLRDAEKITAMMHFDLAILNARKGRLGALLRECLLGFRLAPWTARSWAKSFCAARIYAKLFFRQCARVAGFGKGWALPSLSHPKGERG